MSEQSDLEFGLARQLLAQATEQWQATSMVVAAQWAASILSLYIVWTIVYRLFFHPLASYPGPLLWRISILPSLYYAWTGDRHLVVDKLHKKYGKALRLEPNLVSICTPNAIKTMYGVGTKFEKAMFYTRGPKEKQLLLNLASTTDKTVHARKRRIISHAMSESAIRSYEPTILNKIALFSKGLSDPNSFGGEYKNMARWFSYLTYDIMGQLTFSQSYDMLTKDDHHFIQPLIDSYQHSQVILGTEPKLDQWGLAPLFLLQIMAENKKFRKYVDDQVNHRIAEEKAGRGPPDIFKLLLEHKDKETGESMGFKELSDEAVVLIIAASDTTGTALSGLFFYLSRYPECYKKLQQEILWQFPTLDSIVGGPKLLACKYMRAAVEEALRMSPGVPGFLTREAPQGASIDGYYFAPQVQVAIPTWTMHRNPEVYPDPQVFKPERWMVESEEELQRLRSSYYPFSMGTRGCIGKNMAYHTIYLTIARLVFQFDIENRDKNPPLEYHVKDHFAAGSKDGPYLKFTKRKV
ncbi:cytochrome P450 [Aspergillus karnatakaensis]|uniref:cytochrome P450 n=1 Tax=Aspergillus karnatakaensis TaxID=1810916 RepID=UPI003CCD150C